MRPFHALGSVVFLAFAAAACSDDVPCLSEGASRSLGCNCPPGFHFERESSGSSRSRCVEDEGADQRQDGGGLEGAEKADGGLGVHLDASRDATLPTQGAEPTDRDGAAGGPAVDASADADDADNEADANGGADIGARSDAAAQSNCQPATEVCDGRDNDCDGQVDEAVKVRCWSDADGDGYAAAGAAVTEGCDACAAKYSAQEPVLGKADCDDANAAKNPGATDICGDSIDNDCDGKPDDEANNACGGACSSSLPGKVGDSCNNGQHGACARSGSYECKPDHTMFCNAPAVQPAASDSCGDGIDNDCDDQVDEDGKTWYPDCDGDGFPGSGATKVSCAKPPAVTLCAAWISGPIDKMDCDDGNAFHYPGASYNLGIPAAVMSSIGGVWTPMSTPFPDPKLFDGDVNCDGKVEQAPTMIERMEDETGQQIRHVTYAACTSQNKCATGATSDADVCFEYVLTVAGPQCGVVPIHVAAKNDVTGVCESRQEDVRIVCK